MQSSTPTWLALLLVLTHSLPVLGRDCFLPNGTNSRKLKWVPCGTEDGLHSACCGDGDACSTSGLCQGNAGYMYRGGCTDRNWEAEQCASHCQNNAIDTFSNLYPCPKTNGTYATTFCCSSGDESCCNDTPFSGGFGQFMLVAGASVNSISSQSTSTSPSSTTASSRAASSSPAASSTQTPSAALASTSTQSTTTPPATSSSSKSVALGAGIGVPLGLLLIAALAFLLFQERRSRRRIEQKLASLEQSSTHGQEAGHGYNDPKYRNAGSQHHELNSWQRQPELHSQPVMELDGRH